MRYFVGRVFRILQAPALGRVLAAGGGAVIVSLDWRMGGVGGGRGTGLVTIAVYRGVVGGGRSGTIAVLVTRGGRGVVRRGGAVAIHWGSSGVMGGGGRGVGARVRERVVGVNWLGVGGAPINRGRHVHRGRVRRAALCALSNNKQNRLKNKTQYSLISIL